MFINNILIIGDTHLPFELDGYLDFCRKTQERFKCTKVFHIGDVVDHHSISRFDRDPDGFSPRAEYEKTMDKLRKWFKAFPDCGVCIGNHDERIERLCLQYNISSIYFKTLPELYEFPKTWKYNMDYYIYGVRIFHGMGYGGVAAHKMACVENQMSIAMGHLHANFGTWFTANQNRLNFGLAVGCGVNWKSYAFRYGRDMRRKPIIGCGVIYDGGFEATAVPMRL